MQLLMCNPTTNRRGKVAGALLAASESDLRVGRCPMGAGMLFIKDPQNPARVDWCSEYIIRRDSFDQGRFTLEGSRPAVAVRGAARAVRGWSS